MNYMIKEFHTRKDNVNWWKTQGIGSGLKAQIEAVKIEDYKILDIIMLEEFIKIK